MAAKKVKDTTNVKAYKVQVTANPEFCGVDAGGVQFAHGEALIQDKRMAAWFQEHEGYKVTEVSEEIPETPEAPEVAEETK